MTTYSFLTSLSRVTKGVIVLYADMVLVTVALFAAYALRLNRPFPLDYFLSGWPVLAVMLIMTVLATKWFRIHLTRLGGYDSSAVGNIAMMVAIVTVTGTAMNIAFGLGAPRTAPVIAGVVLAVLIFLFRFFAIGLLRWLENRGLQRVPIAIYGAGVGGLQLIAALKTSQLYRPVLLVDDSSALHGLTVSGLTVHPVDSLERHFAKGRIEKVFLAMPSLSPAKRRRKIETLAHLGCEVQELPSYTEIIESGGILDSLRPVTPESLLGREGVDLDTPEIRDTYAGANVMVSGAGGSIGSELCRMVLETKPAKLLLFELSEYALYAIERELRPLAEAQGVELVGALGNVTDSRRLTALFQQHSISVVLHAAAYKHVPLIEDNELEGIRNNVLGTRTIARTAERCGVARFIMVSTDKAVRPTNVMGATKRLGELVVQDLASAGTGTVFAIVRFGNVLGSSGSVIPLFRQQIENGGPVTVTHDDVTRYFMTIPEAARLVLLAGSYAEGGEVFVLDMGQPVKIRDLARQMIELSGRSVRDAAHPDGDIEIRVTGLRPGEKLYEELLIGADTLPTPHAKIMRAKESSLPSRELEGALFALVRAVQNEDAHLARATLRNCVEGYQAVAA